MHATIITRVHGTGEEIVQGTSYASAGDALAFLARMAGAEYASIPNRVRLGELTESDAEAREDEIRRAFAAMVDGTALHHLGTYGDAWEIAFNGATHRVVMQDRASAPAPADVRDDEWIEARIGHVLPYRSNPRIVAAWESRGGKYWSILLRGDYGYEYLSASSGGAIDGRTEAPASDWEAIARMESPCSFNGNLRRVDIAQNDANMTPMKRVICRAENRAEVQA